jgi:hypothetical protein
VLSNTSRYLTTLGSRIEPSDTSRAASEWRWRLRSQDWQRVLTRFIVFRGVWSPKGASRQHNDCLSPQRERFSESPSRPANTFTRWRIGQPYWVLETCADDLRTGGLHPTARVLQPVLAVSLPFASPDETRRFCRHTNAIPRVVDAIAPRLHNRGEPASPESFSFLAPIRHWPKSAHARSLNSASILQPRVAFEDVPLGGKDWQIEAGFGSLARLPCHWGIPLDRACWIVYRLPRKLALLLSSARSCGMVKNAAALANSGSSGLRVPASERVYVCLAFQCLRDEEKQIPDRSRYS